VTGSVGIVHTGRDNLESVRKALEHLGADVKVCEQPDDISGVDRLILPGVGAFRDSMDHLVAAGLPDALHALRATGRPILGVCLGMQLLCRRSSEGGECAGLGWIAADVEPFDLPGLRVPHIGWNDVTVDAASPLFKTIEEGADFYFAHSYHVVCDDERDVDAWCDHGLRFAAAVRHENIAAVQFHPEKSQDHGLAILDAFLDWEP
jgi:glutamine amidotransferase